MRTLYVTVVAAALSATMVAAQGTMAQGMAKDKMAPMMSMPMMGEKAKDFTLAHLDGSKVSLSQLEKNGPVVLLMLRGWVGYQCPFCTKQVGDFITHAKEFEAAGANVLLVYPGAADMVPVKASDFVAGKTMPSCEACDQWTDEAVWIKANPNLDVSITRKYLREQVTEAQGMPSKQNIVKRLNFCIWTEQNERWIDMTRWDACGLCTMASATRSPIFANAARHRHMPCRSMPSQ